MENLAARGVLGLVWLLSRLPLGLQAAVGRGLGHAMHALAGERRRVTHANLALCLPELDAAARDALVREHFALTGRSVLERGLLWHAPEARLMRLIHVEGDVHFAERHAGPVMWLVPHFLGLEVAGAATQLHQRRLAFDVYTPQSVAVFDAALLKGRGRFGRAEFLRRDEGARAIVKAIRRGRVFFNAPDMDFGLRDAAFVPFFGQPAATLLAPSRLARSLGMAVQPVVAEMLPGGAGYRVVFGEPWTDWPSDDPVADAARMNAFIEQQIRQRPAQYLWMHKRFKSRPEGAPPVYGEGAPRD
jgi:Kdo2-lipid IVA lauroyltransferase/acyltransferase